MFVRNESECMHVRVYVLFMRRRLLALRLKLLSGFNARCDATRLARPFTSPPLLVTLFSHPLTPPNASRLGDGGRLNRLEYRPGRVMWVRLDQVTHGGKKKSEGAQVICRLIGLTRRHVGSPLDYLPPLREPNVSETCLEIEGEREREKEGKGGLWTAGCGAESSFGEFGKMPPRHGSRARRKWTAGLFHLRNVAVKVLEGGREGRDEVRVGETFFSSFTHCPAGPLDESRSTQRRLYTGAVLRYMLVCVSGIGGFA